MDNHLNYFLRLAANAQRAGDMHIELWLAAERRKRGNRDQLAGFKIQSRSLIDIAESKFDKVEGGKVWGY